MQDTVLCRHKHKQGGGKSPPRSQYNTLASFGSEVRNSYGITIEFALQTRVQNWRRMQVQHPVNKRFRHSPPLGDTPQRPAFLLAVGVNFAGVLSIYCCFSFHCETTFLKNTKVETFVFFENGGKVKKHTKILCAFLL